MASGYSAIMSKRQPLPDIWLISDARNNGGLAAALARLPRGSGFIYRHYHLGDHARRARFLELAQIARAQGHLVIVAGDAQTAHDWGADGIYGAPAMLGAQHPELLRLATAHDADEVTQANRAGADAVLISPVFATASHPDAKPLGPARFRELATHAQMSVIALGGMTAERAKTLDWPRWAAIDGLS
ncbi:MAG: thiamine phosphate synthase [Erythrobacter sp. RIFCSPHIGHO2_12_FULL_63_10]|nr:MAG: thiamine phosphate synthase [Erythrobacter sp. RIFCSPHIGHO2_12_FULL_63_10]